MVTLVKAFLPLLGSLTAIKVGSVVLTLTLGKSRSIAIPENRIAAEERKKQKLTKEKILELKRQVTAEGSGGAQQIR